MAEARHSYLVLLAAEEADHTLAAEVVVHSLAEAAVRSLVEAAVRNLAAGVVAHIPVEGHVGHILMVEAAVHNLAEEAAVHILAEEGAVHIPVVVVADRSHQELHTAQMVGHRTVLVVAHHSHLLLLGVSLAHPEYHMKNLLRPVTI